MSLWAPYPPLDLGKGWEAWHDAPDGGGGRDNVNTQLLEMCSQWETIVEQLFPECLDSEGHVDSGFNLTCTYNDSEGAETKCKIPSALAQVFNHATHHRGQVTVGLNMLGRYRYPCMDMQRMGQGFLGYEAD